MPFRITSIVPSNFDVVALVVLARVKRRIW